MERYSDYDGTSGHDANITTYRGGAIYNNSSGGLFTIKNSTFNNNAATGNGGAILSAGPLTIGTQKSNG